MNERREFRRRRVGGNAEITSVMGAGTLPEARAGILDCSLGGARLRVHSPSRRLFRAVPPCLNARDSITCVLRLAPGYDAIDMFAEVVRVQRAEAEPDYLDVGVRFFHDTARRSHAERPMARLARILEPDRSEEEAAALAMEALAKVKPPEAPAPAAPSAPAPAPASTAPAPSPRDGQRLTKQSRRERPSGDDADPASRLVEPRRPSGRHVPRASQRLERGASARQPAQTTPRAAASGVERATSARASQISERVRRPRAATPAPASSSSSSDCEVVAWASSRLAAAVHPPERVTTTENEASVRGSARLRAGEAVIELPGAFTARARESGLTAHVTPTDPCAGLYVAERSPARLVVRELNGGRTDASFDFLVIAALRVH